MSQVLVRLTWTYVTPTFVVLSSINMNALNPVVLYCRVIL